VLDDPPEIVGSPVFYLRMRADQPAAQIAAPDGSLEQLHLVARHLFRLQPHAS
jgi:hypothetical protein